MTTPRSPKQHPRPSLPVIAATTAALPAVVLSSLAMAQPAAAESRAADRARHARCGHAGPGSGAEVRRHPCRSVSASIPSSLRPAQPAAPAEYTIARGDTISSIAGRFGLDTYAVLKLNNLQPNTIIYPGQKIKLTGSAAAPAAPAAKPAAPAAATASTGGSVYTVKSGDTLGAIAARHGVKLSEVLGWNGLNMSSIIYPGQKIKIGGGQSAAPAPAASPAPAPAQAPAPGRQFRLLHGQGRRHAVRHCRQARRQARRTSCPPTS